MEVTLAKRWKNHPVGTVLRVSPGVKRNLTELDVLEKEKRKRKARKAPSEHKMIGEAPAAKAKKKTKGAA